MEAKNRTYATPCAIPLDSGEPTPVYCSPNLRIKIQGRTMQELKTQDPQVAKAIELEEQRQLSKLELIASENFTSPAVRQAMGSVMTHKYAEGYPGKRYYGGWEFVDQAEDLARDRACELFSCQY